MSVEADMAGSIGRVKKLDSCLLRRSVSESSSLTSRPHRFGGAGDHCISHLIVCLREDSSRLIRIS